MTSTQHKRSFINFIYTYLSLASGVCDSLSAFLQKSLHFSQRTEPGQRDKSGCGDSEFSHNNGITDMCERQCLCRHGNLFIQAVQRCSHFTSGLHLQLANVSTPSTCSACVSSVFPHLFIGLAILVIIVSTFLKSFYRIYFFTSAAGTLQYSHCGIIKNIFVLLL